MRIGDLAAGGTGVARAGARGARHAATRTARQHRLGDVGHRRPDQSDNSATATVEAVAQADVAVTKELVTPNPVAGEPLEFRLIVVNNGPTVAPNASISDTLAPGLTFRSGSASQGTCKLDEAEDGPVTASCDLGRMAVGATVTATLVVDTDPSLTTISNIAFAGSGGLDISTFDNEDGLEFPSSPSPTSR